MSSNKVIKIHPIYAILFALSTLFGCQSVDKTPPDAETPPVETPPPIDEVTLYEWLDEAANALANNHLTYPEEGSALSIYQRILKREPGQEDAQRGLETIVEAFVQQSLHALDQRSFAHARSLLDRARLVLPEHPSIEPTAEQIRLISQAHRTSVKLSQQSIKTGSNHALNELRQLGRAPAGLECRFIISALNDRQGRWIYQHLSQGAGSARLRTRVRLQLPAGVERLCFDS